MIDLIRAEKPIQLCLSITMQVLIATLVVVWIDWMIPTKQPEITFKSRGYFCRVFNWLPETALNDKSRMFSNIRGTRLKRVIKPGFKNLA